MRRWGGVEWKAKRATAKFWVDLPDWMKLKIRSTQEYFLHLFAKCRWKCRRIDSRPQPAIDIKTVQCFSLNRNERLRYYNIHFLSARFLICQRLHSNRSADWIYDAVATQSNLSLIKLPPQIIRQYDLLLRKAVIVGNWSGATLCELLLARPDCRCTNRSNVH